VILTERREVEKKALCLDQHKGRGGCVRIELGGGAEVLGHGWELIGSHGAGCVKAVEVNNNGRCIQERQR
jgi:hypothetical protein